MLKEEKRSIKIFIRAYPKGQRGDLTIGITIAKSKEVDVVLVRGFNLHSNTLFGNVIEEEIAK